MSGQPNSLRSALTGDQLPGWVARRRRLLAATAAALTALGLLSVLHPRAGPSVRVLVAAADLPAGTVVEPAELRSEQLPLGDEPRGALASTPAGRVLVAALPAGEPLTETALAAPGYLAPGTVETAVELANPAASAALVVGELVEVLAAAPGAAAAATLATDARLAALPAPGLVVLVVAAAQAPAIAAAAASDRIFVAVESLG